MSFFSLDSKFSQIMGRVFDLMMLNIIFLIMCIPIVTIGANFTAMYYVTLKMIKNEETYIFRTYWKSFRENFKQATAIWLILLAVLIVLILDLLLVMRMPGTITYLRFVFLVLIFFEAMVLSYVFPVLSRFDNTVKNTIKNSILMAFPSDLAQKTAMAPLIPATLFSTPLAMYGRIPRTMSIPRAPIRQFARAKPSSLPMTIPL